MPLSFVQRSGLPWPRFAPGFPVEISIGVPNPHAEALAEAMLAEGVLQESDWTGDLFASIAGGLMRWVGSVLGGKSLERVELSLCYSDDIRGCSQMSPELWYEAGPGRKKDEPVGILALRSPTDNPLALPLGHPGRNVIVGKTVEALEAVRHGLGYQILFLLQDVLPRTVLAATPHYGLDQVRKYAALVQRLRAGVTKWDLERAGALSPEVSRMRALTEEAYFAKVPREACVGKVRQKVIRDAAMQLASLPPWAQPIVTRAAQLQGQYLAARESTFRCEAPAFVDNSTIVLLHFPGMAAKLCPFSVRWSADDHLAEIVEMYHSQLRQNVARHGESSATDLLWVQGWQSSNPAATRETVRNWKNAASLALRGCQLAEMMHREPNRGRGSGAIWKEIQE
jgi:hypothetical protein